MRFGTDGVRGVANAELTAEFALRLGRAAARVLGGPTLLIGRDPRRSGTLLESAVAAGACAEGVDVELLGVAPTPAVAHLAAARHLPAAMISASHNPAADNGVKLFAAGGLKLSDEVQARVEAELDALASGAPDAAPPTGSAVGQVRRSDERVLAPYEAHVAAALEGRRLDGLRVVLDCANGAAAGVAPAVFRGLGAEVTVIHATPDGLNINEACGSTHPEDLSDATVDAGAELGFAFDGDADRVLAVDAAGRLIDGDQLIAAAALDLRQRGRLRDDTVVVTVMSNLGFRHGMAAAGITVAETPVGDRHVLEALDRGNWSLGGEQSGHLIFRDLATTGDGLLSAVVVADLVRRSGRPLSALVDQAMTRLPQVLRNVRLAERHPDLLERLRPEIDQATAELGRDGRVLVRASGTEPLIRVMVEAVDEARAASIADRLVAATQAAAG